MTSRFLIEISRDYGAKSQHQMEDAIRLLGSHFVTHADWTLEDGKYTGKIIAEAPDREAALLIVPPSMRVHARILELEAAATVH